MTCEELAPFISAFHDGEDVNPVALEHILQCNNCSQRLKTYKLLGCELRMLASCQSARASVPDSLRAQIAAPASRFVPGFQWLASAIAGAVLAVIAVVPIVRAQSDQPKWFQFSFGPSPDMPDFRCAEGWLRFCCHLWRRPSDWCSLCHYKHRRQHRTIGYSCQGLRGGTTQQFASKARSCWTRFSLYPGYCAFGCLWMAGECFSCEVKSRIISRNLLSGTQLSRALTNWC